MPSTKTSIITVGVTGASGAIFAQKDPFPSRKRRARLAHSSGHYRDWPATFLRRAGHHVRRSEETSRAHSGPRSKENRDHLQQRRWRFHCLWQLPRRRHDRDSLHHGRARRRRQWHERRPTVPFRRRHAQGATQTILLCVRDTPFNRIHLENMLRAQQAGAVIMPIVPSFYHNPKSIDDVVTQFVCRVLAQAGLPQDNMFRWTGSAAGKRSGS